MEIGFGCFRSAVESSERLVIDSYRDTTFAPLDIHLREERNGEKEQKPVEGFHEWNYINAQDRELVLIPVGWDTHSTPTMGDRPQAIINKDVLKDCDLLVAVFDQQRSDQRNPLPFHAALSCRQR